ncbi:hypothetical protein BCR43DRAFT_296838 [Syncephalastrum racemosum]|uniref:Uncharacterized protein n=1 Tax=Syncephalastrum racemosum TaxID=13706 RepID=A0A1X2H9D8_SYNRA|nr:hypothetical protein BCR43DRAFT_296838 [Syncephalastrum racemosum]
MSLWKDDDYNWDNDIEFSSRDLLQDEPYPSKYGWFSSDPDKNLASALAKIAYNEDDDNLTESTFMSNHSDKLTIDETDTLRIPGLDDYMLQQPSSPGNITRLGKHRRMQDAGDWCEDIEFPLKGLIQKHKQRQREQQEQQENVSFRPNETDTFSLLNDDDDGDNEDEEKERKNTDKSAAGRHVRFNPTDQVRPLYSPEPDQVDFDGVEFPDDMELKRNPIKAIAKETIKPYQEAGDEEEDFCKGLDVEDDSVFHLHARRNKENEKKTQPLRTVPTAITNTSSTNKASGIPRRIQSSKPAETKFWSLPSRHQRFRAPTYASRQKEIATQPAPQKQRVDTIKDTTLMAKPRSRTVYGNGSELDSLDNLPEWKRSLLRRPTPLRRPTTAQSKIPMAQSKPPTAGTGTVAGTTSSNNNNSNVDPQRPWRHNMTRRKPTLIRPEEHFEKHVNNMQYNPVSHQWQGNEQSLASFESSGPPPRQQQRQRQQQQPQKPQQRCRPALITNMQKNGKSKYTELARGDMVFDHIRMRWHKAQQSEEDHSLDHLEDLEPPASPRQRQPSPAGPSHHDVQQERDTCQPGRHTYREFALSREQQRHMHAEEEEHRVAMQPWAHASVRPSAYLFYDGSDEEM